MSRIKIIIEYDGGRYHGFQLQTNANTVQAEIEKAIAKLCGQKVSVICAGRTDAGVHALGQVIAFDIVSSIPPERWSFAINSFLPEDIRALHSCAVPDQFNPRFDAVSKRYKYLIYRSHTAVTFHRRYALCNTENLDVPAMQAAAQYIEGRHDFRSFCASGSSAKTFIREVSRCRLADEFPFLRLEIEANAFLYNMIRIITGTLLEVGRGAYPPEHVQKIIAAQDRTLAGPTVLPCGLYLESVHY